MRIGELKRQARESLDGRWLKAAGTTLVYLLLTFILPSIIQYFLQKTIGKTPGSLIGSIISIIVNSLFSVGFLSYFISLADREKDTSISKLFSGTSSFLKVIGCNLLIFIVIFLVVSIIVGIGFIILFATKFSLYTILFELLVGIILYILIFYLSLRVSFVLMIFADDNSFGVFKAIGRSFYLTKGYTWKLFLTCLSFIGWIILCIFIIPIFFVIPYIQLTIVNFYNSLKNIKDANEQSATEG